MLLKKYVFLILLLVVGVPAREATRNEGDCNDYERSVGECGWPWWQKAVAGVAGGAALVGGVTVGLPLLGFTSAGIAAGSVASSLMSASAVSSGGGVVAGGLVATAQSVAVTGIGAKGVAMVAGATYAVTDVGSRAWCWLKNERKENEKN